MLTYTAMGLGLGSGTSWKLAHGGKKTDKEKTESEASFQGATTRTRTAAAVEASQSGGPDFKSTFTGRRKGRGRRTWKWRSVGGGNFERVR